MVLESSNSVRANQGPPNPNRMSQVQILSSRLQALLFTQAKPLFYAPIPYLL